MANRRKSHVAKVMVSREKTVQARRMPMFRAMVFLVLKMIWERQRGSARARCYSRL
jgi:hypothetical protein